MGKFILKESEKKRIQSLYGLNEQSTTNYTIKQLQELILSKGGKLPKFGADGSYGGETANAILDLLNTKPKSTAPQPMEKKQAGQIQLGNEQEKTQEAQQLQIPKDEVSVEFNDNNNQQPQPNQEIIEKCKAKGKQPVLAKNVEKVKRNGKQVNKVVWKCK